MHRLTTFLTIVIVAVLLSACHSTIHEYPDGTAASAVIRLTVDNSPPVVDRIIDYTGPTPRVLDAAGLTRTEWTYTRTIDPERWLTHIVWELHEGTLSDVRSHRSVLLQRGSATTSLTDKPVHTVLSALPAGRYTLLAWADYIPQGTASDYHYDTSDMTSVKCDLDKRAACTDNSERDCFASAYEFEVAEVLEAGEQRTFETVLRRPQGRYIVLAADYDEYLKLTDTPVTELKSSLVYPSYINTAYSVTLSRPNESSTSLAYSAIPRLYGFGGREMALVADDYSFVNADESHLTLDVTLTTQTGTLLSASSGIDIPLRADKLTIVVGRFLTTDRHEGGFSVDEGFAGEIVIPF